METVVIGAGMLGQLRGVIVSRKPEIGDSIQVNEVEMKVKNVRQLLITWYAGRSVLTIRCGAVYFTTGKNKEAFLNACGFRNEKDFMLVHMTDPVFVFGAAETKRYLIDLYEPFI